MVVWNLAFALTKYLSRCNQLSQLNKLYGHCSIGFVIDFEQVSASWIIVFMLHVYLLIDSCILEIIFVEAIAQKCGGIQ